MQQQIINNFHILFEYYQFNLKAHIIAITLIKYLFRNIEMQQSQRIKIFSRFTETIKEFINLPTINAINSRYYIRQFKIAEIDVSLAINLYFGIVTRNKKSIAERNQLGWVENELRIFVWTLVFYAQSRKINLEQMAQDIAKSDWTFFSDLFPNKQKILFAYQCKNILKNHNQYKKWVHQEDELFEELVKKDNNRLKWSDLGKFLYIQSNKKYFRTPKQCRQRWLNHLDPSKLKKYWLEQEDFILIQFVKFNGKKWALISKKLDNKRNEHSIKNRFKSLLTKQSKLFHRAQSQQQLINNIYSKLAQNLSKNRQEKQQNQNCSIQKRNSCSIIQHQQISFQSQQSEGLIQIYQKNEPSKPQQEQLNKEILVNISLNKIKNSDESSQKSKNPELNLNSKDKLAFQFCKSIYQNAPGRQWHQQMIIESEVEKRIRADLFLQQDPFEMLKSYFYQN